MNRRLTLTALVAVLGLAIGIAACRGGGEQLGPEYSLGREIIETFAAYVGERPSDIRVRLDAWDHLHAENPDIADAIGKYVEEAGIGFPAWTQDPDSIPRLAPPLVPRVIGVIAKAPPYFDYGRFTIQIGYGSGPQPCLYLMVVEPVDDGGWRVEEPEIECHGGVLS